MTSKIEELQDTLTYEKMQDLINCVLYFVKDGKATPNYCYCKPDAPVYQWQDDKEAFVKV